MNGLIAALSADDGMVEHIVRDEATGHRYLVVCVNCDNRKCMSCIGREMHDHCLNDCPDCCPAEHSNITRYGPNSVYLALIGDDA